MSTLEERKAVTALAVEEQMAGVEVEFHVDIEGMSAVDMEIGSEGLTLVIVAGRAPGIVATTRHIREFAPGSVVVGHMECSGSAHAALIDLVERGVPTLW